MLPVKKLSWAALSVALVATVLMATACGGTSQNTASAPTAVGHGDSTGVSDTEIKFGTHYPLSGNPAAVYAPIAYGMKAFFDYINAQGGVYGRKISLIIADDHYNPPDTVEVVKKLVEQDNVFGIVSGLGEETHAAVYQYLQDKGVPDMYLSTGLDKWTNPISKNRFAGNPDYITEGTFLGQWIAKTYPEAKIGVLEQNDELGQDGEKGLRAGIQDSGVQIVSVEQYDASQSDVSAQTARLKNTGADTLVVFAIPPQAASLVNTARDTLGWNVPIVVSNINCSDIFVALAGKNSEGIISDTFGYQAYNTDQPGVQKYENIWDEFENGTTGPLTNFELYGMAMAEATVWDLEMAGKDLTRETFLDAAESACNVWCSTCFAPSSTSPTDHKVSEAVVLNVVTNGKWVTQGDIVSYESTKSCTPATPPPGFDQQPKLGRDAPFVETQ
ncbi:MAG: ABC transporter substrate-binding protein [Dehalococcoidia bacterium]